MYKKVFNKNVQAFIFLFYNSFQEARFGKLARVHKMGNQKTATLSSCGINMIEHIPFLQWSLFFYSLILLFFDNYQPSIHHIETGWDIVNYKMNIYNLDILPSPPCNCGCADVDNMDY